jgi:hypothetical protein
MVEARAPNVSGLVKHASSVPFPHTKFWRGVRGLCMRAAPLVRWLVILQLFGALGWFCDGRTTCMDAERVWTTNDARTHEGHQRLAADERLMTRTTWLGVRVQRFTCCFVCCVDLVVEGPLCCLRSAFVVYNTSTASCRWSRNPIATAFCRCPLHLRRSLCSLVHTLSWSLGHLRSPSQAGLAAPLPRHFRSRCHLSHRSYPCSKCSKVQHAERLG